MNTKTASLSISSTACTDKDDTISYPLEDPGQYTPTPTDNFNLCYTPSPITNYQNTTQKSDISPISKPIKVISTKNTAFPDIETPKDMLLSDHEMKDNKQTINKHQISHTTNKHNSIQPKEKRFSLIMTDNSNIIITKNNPLLSKEQQTLLSKGYRRGKFIAKTLQGEVFEAKVLYGNGSNDGTVVIKTANKILHQKGITITENGKIHKINENIFKEAMLMKKFTNNNPPKSMIKYHDFFYDEKQFYLVMEKGGDSLFEITVSFHKLINCGQLSIAEWRDTVKDIFGEMVEFIQWMHNDMQCCNMDISLENIILANDYDTGHNLIKFIDFGLTQQFNKDKNPKFICNQFGGKTGYKSPQSYRKKRFQANKADIWSLGVCLFMLIIGAPPYKIPHSKDIGFKMIKCGQMKELLIQWDRLRYLTPDLYDLLCRMLCYDEGKRIDIDGVANHLWIRSYFKNHNINKKEKKMDGHKHSDIACNDGLISNKLTIIIPNELDLSIKTKNIDQM